LGVHVVGRQRAGAGQVLLIFGDGSRMAFGAIERWLAWDVPPAARARRTGARQRIEGPPRRQHAPETAPDRRMRGSLEAPGHA